MDIKDIKLEAIGLSNRSYNALTKAGLRTIGDIMDYDEAAFLALPALGANSVKEIIQKRDSIINGEREGIGEDEPSLLYGNDFVETFEFRLDPEYRGSILSYTTEKNRPIDELGLGGRPLNQLRRNGFRNLSDIVFLTREELKALPAMGEQSINKVLECIEKYFSDNEKQIRALHDGDTSVLWDDDIIRQNILCLYNETAFGGLSFREIKEKLVLPEDYPEDHLKSLIGHMLAEKELEYVDFRLYRCYRSFEEYAESAPVKSDRNKTVLLRRLRGETLVEIGDDYDLTRERVRQIVNKTYKEVQAIYSSETGLKWFDEEYYTYFYKTYAFDKKDGSRWFNISPATWRYLDMLDIKQGKKDLNEAVDDPDLDVGLRLKIKNYINRNKVFIDGAWVLKRRDELEEAAVRACCKDNVSFTEFCDKYNEFLQQHGVDYDEKLYITEAVRNTRKSHLPNERFLLWKQNETIRYYNIDSRDYSELLDELHLDSYENIELSTVKLMNDHQDIMKRYDIRDQYELHNLLRKIVPEGSYHNFRCGRTPMITFGEFDRDQAIEDLLIENAPIEAKDFADIINDEYGYDQATIIGTYLRSVSKYYSHGVYTVDHKVMTPENMTRLSNELSEDFYYIDEVRKIYKRILPDADPEEINSFNLKTMGFSVLSKYVLHNFPSLDAYFEHLFTETDTVDIRKYKRRFGTVGMFYQKLMEMKRNLRVVEFEPDQLITFDRLERSGVTKKMIQDYCDKVYAFVGTGRYFSSQSIRNEGFEHELYDLGFSDWFYANLLLSDDRFSFNRIYGNIILYTGNEAITISSFQANVIENHGSIDTYDLMNELEEVYGCTAFDRYDITYRIKGTDVFYDGILDRLYASVDEYENELEAAEVF